jgi:hypothetical protein
MDAWINIALEMDLDPTNEVKVTDMGISQPQLRLPSAQPTQADGFTTPSTNFQPYVMMFQYNQL